MPYVRPRSAASTMHSANYADVVGTVTDSAKPCKQMYKRLETCSALSTASVSFAGLPRSGAGAHTMEPAPGELLSRPLGLPASGLEEFSFGVHPVPGSIRYIFGEVPGDNGRPFARLKIPIAQR